MNEIVSTGQIISLSNVLSKKNCVDCISASEETNLFPKSTKSIPKDICKSPDNRIFIESPELAKIVWSKIYKKVAQTHLDFQVIGINNCFRLYKYLPTQNFRKHQDIDFVINEDERSFYSLLIYLNEDFEGGETEFENISYKPKIGSALIFPHMLLHSGAVIKSGIKYVLRSDVIYKRIPESCKSINRK